MSSALGWIAVEGVARLVLGAPFRDSDRVLLLSAPNWASTGRALHYAPDAEIREVALYGDRIEYDVRFRTNELGFVDDRSYRAPSEVPPERRWAFVGDSFTAGYHGGAPWIPRLRARAASRAVPVEIYDLGVSGAGFANFLPLLELAERELDFRRVAILFISDDLMRNAWRPVVAGGRMSVCPAEGEAAPWPCEPTRMLVLDDREADADGLRARVRASGLVAPPRTAGEWLARVSFAGAALARAASHSRTSEGVRGRADLSAWLADLAPLAAEREVRFVQIPERDEALSGSHRFELRGAIEAAGYRYASLLDGCGLGRDDYYRIDGHLNRRGYDRLQGCVGRVLGITP